MLVKYALPFGDEKSLYKHIFRERFSPPGLAPGPNASAPRCEHENGHSGLFVPGGPLGYSPRPCVPIPRVLRAEASCFPAGTRKPSSHYLSGFVMPDRVVRIVGYPSRTPPAGLQLYAFVRGGIGKCNSLRELQAPSQRG